jgi:hypothetical protein
MLDSLSRNPSKNELKELLPASISRPFHLITLDRVGELFKLEIHGIIKGAENN